MTKSEKRLAELERKVAALEARPPLYISVPVPYPVYPYPVYVQPVIPTYVPPIHWTTTCGGTAGTANTLGSTVTFTGGNLGGTTNALPLLTQ